MLKVFGSQLPVAYLPPKTALPVDSPLIKVQSPTALPVSASG
jgi:hypothetical protein